ncbi:MAG: ROK family protein [Demequinaceae bacterium]|nr:ROK family protein [Demequinaceae bacterium]
MSRSEVTRRTQLNRSTVGALVTELVELGLAYETPPEEQAQRGRPSPIVHPNSKVSALVVNPDVEALTLGLVGLGGVVHKRVRHALDRKPSPREAIDVTVDLVKGMGEELERDYRVIGVGLAIPGLVRNRDGLVRRAPYLDWTSEPFAEHVSRALGLPTFAGNDASVAMISESLYGAGRGVSNLVYLNGFLVGIGGGVMVAGVPLVGEDGYAAELGHTVVSEGSLRCHCGRLGCLETEVNFLRLREAMSGDPVDLYDLDSVLTTTTDRGLLLEAERQINVLAEAIANFISVFNPEVVLLGGFLGSLEAAFPDLVRRKVYESSFAPLAENVRIERATLRTPLPLLGSAELAFTPLLRDPAGVALPLAYGGPPAA